MLAASGLDAVAGEQSRASWPCRLLPRLRGLFVAPRQARGGRGAVSFVRAEVKSADARFSTPLARVRLFGVCHLSPRNLLLSKLSNDLVIDLIDYSPRRF